MRFRGALTIGLLAVGIFPVTPAHAFPRGNLRTWVESRHFQYGAFARDIDFNTTIFHTDGIWFPDNAGVWTTFLEYTSFDAQVLVEGRDMPTNLGRLTVSMGDFGWENFEDDLRREYRQNVLIRGASLSLKHGPEWTVAAGALTERGVFMGSGRKSRGIAVGRLGVGAPWKEKGRWELEWDKQAASEDFLGRQVGTAYVAQVLSEQWKAQTEGRLSHNSLGQLGSSLAGGITHQASRTTFGLSGRRVSRNFRGIGLYRDPHLNEAGGRIYGATRFSRNGLSGFFFDWARDLGTNDLGRQAEERLHTRLNVSTGLTGSLYLQGRISLRNRTTVDPDSLLVDQNTISGRVETGIRTRRLQGFMSYGRGLFRSRMENEPDWHEDRFETQTNLRLGSWFRAQLTGRYTERRLPDGTWMSREKRGEIRLLAEPSEYRRGWLSGGLEQQDAATKEFQRDNFLLGAGWYQSLFKDFGLEVEADLTIGNTSHQVESLRWSGRFIHRFASGGRRARVDDRSEEFGTVSGFVFEDLNGNGSKDPLEPGIPGQLLTLGSGPSMTTRDDGSFYFEKAAVVLDFMRFKAAHLPSRYLPPQAREYDLRLKPGGDRHIDIAVQLAASIRGRVVSVLPGGTKRGVSGALIRILGTHRDAFTNDQGEYLLIGLKPGKQVLELVDWSIPENHEIQGSLLETMTLEAGVRAVAEDFKIESKDPALLQWFKIR